MNQTVCFLGGVDYSGIPGRELTRVIIGERQCGHLKTQACDCALIAVEASDV
jgi:hypothetical protein